VRDPPTPEEPCEDDADCATGNCDRSLPLPHCGPPKTPTLSPSVTFTPGATATPSGIRDDGCTIFEASRPAGLWLLPVAFAVLRRRR